jgi:hypothetical protein
MREISPKNLVKALERKGFQKVGGTKHDHYCFFYNGLRTDIRVVISRGSKHTYSGYLLTLLSQEMYLAKKQLECFIDCSLSEEMYIEHLIEKNKLSEES